MGKARTADGGGAVKDAISFTVYGQLYSMKNSKFGYYKHPKAHQFVRDFMLQAAQFRPDEPWTEDVGCEVRVWYPSRRQDLDCALVYDCLEKAGFIEDDRQVRLKLETAKIDKDAPRVWVKVWREI
jgi:Holliday junction resolvase RusA-like endonuclease